MIKSNLETTGPGLFPADIRGFAISTFCSQIINLRLIPFVDRLTYT